MFQSCRWEKISTFTVVSDWEFVGSLISIAVTVDIFACTCIIRKKEGISGFRRLLDFSVRDWSLITGRGLQNGKIAPPPQDRVKRFAPPPLLKSGNFLHPPFNMTKTSSYHVKTTPKIVVSPFSRAKTFPPPLFRRGKTSHPRPPSSFAAVHSP